MKLTKEQVRKIKAESFYRSVSITREAVDEDARTVEVAFSSEDPYERWFGMEILGHNEGEVVDDFIKSGSAPLLNQHRHDNQIGVIEKAWIDPDRKGRALVRFGKAAGADEIFQDVIDGIRSNISVGYRINKMDLVEKDDNIDTYRATSWEPYEVSFVSVPADKTVGVGRAHEIAAIEKSDLEEDMKEGQEKKDNLEEVKAKAEAEGRQEGRSAEVARVRDIMAIGGIHKMPEAAERFVADGKSTDEFRAYVLEELRKTDSEPVDPPDPNIGLNQKEVKQFSFMKLVRALADPKHVKEAGFELECSRAFEEKVGRTAKGAFVPHEVLADSGYTRDLGTNVGTAGGYLVETMTGSFIEMLRNSAAVMRLGTRVLSGLVGDIDIPKQTGGATAYWVNEGGDLTESQQTLGQIRMSPKTIGCYTDITRRMMLQSSIDVENFVRQDFALQMGIAVDLGAMTGSAASGEPRGILETSGIGSVTLNAANTPDWGDIVDLETAIATDNALFGSLAYLTNATIVGKMKQTEKASSTGKFIYEDGMLNGYRCETSNNVPAKYMIFANWADMIIGMWSGLDVTIDTTSLSTSGGTRVVCFQDIDIAIRHAESFAQGYKA